MILFRGMCESLLMGHEFSLEFTACVNAKEVVFISQLIHDK
jgi:hypothetical protein